VRRTAARSGRRPGAASDQRGRGMASREDASGDHESGGGLPRKRRDESRPRGIQWRSSRRLQFAGRDRGQTRTSMTRDALTVWFDEQGIRVIAIPSFRAFRSKGDDRSSSRP